MRGPRAGQLPSAGTCWGGPPGTGSLPGDHPRVHHRAHPPARPGSEATEKERVVVGGAVTGPRCLPDLGEQVLVPDQHAGSTDVVDVTLDAESLADDGGGRRLHDEGRVVEPRVIAECLRLPPERVTMAAPVHHHNDVNPAAG